MVLPVKDKNSEEPGGEDTSAVSDEGQNKMKIEFHRLIDEGMEDHAHRDNSQRRFSLPPGLLDHTNTHVFCGQILRFMGDEHFSKTCGRHLRYMGDEICCQYGWKKVLMGYRPGSPSCSVPVSQEHLTPNTHSLPDLRRHGAAKNEQTEEEDNI